MLCYVASHSHVKIYQVQCTVNTANIKPPTVSMSSFQSVTYLTESPSGLPYLVVLYNFSHTTSCIDIFSSSHTEPVLPLSPSASALVPEYIK